MAKATHVTQMLRFGLAAVLGATTMASSMAQGSAPQDGNSRVFQRDSGVKSKLDDLRKSGVQLRGHRALSKIATRFNLTNDQNKQIAELLKGAKSQAKAIRSNESQTVGAMRAQLSALRELTRNQIRAVLTDDQRAKWDAKHKNHKNKAPRRDIPPTI